MHVDGDAVIPKHLKIGFLKSAILCVKFPFLFYNSLKNSKIEKFVFIPKTNFSKVFGYKGGINTNAGNRIYYSLNGINWRM